MSRLSVILAVSCLALGGCDSAGEGQAQRENATAPSEPVGAIDRSQAGTPMPALTFSDPSGAELDLADLKGKPVLVNLWATWCAPCVVEMPMLDTLAGELGDDVKVLTVSQDVRGADLVAPFFGERNFRHLEPWLDPDGELSAAINPEGIMPLTVLFDAEGREVLRVTGDYKWDSEDAIAEISEAIAE